MRILVAVGLVIGLSGSMRAASSSVNLAQIDRSIGKEPSYQSKSPKYCLLVFGRQAQARVWLVLDGDEGDVLYVDRNGDGNLAGKDERIPATESENAFVVKGLGLTVGGAKLHYQQLAVKRWCGGKKIYGMTLDTHHWSQLAGGEGLKFADRPAQAPIIHFDGPLAMGDTRQALGKQGSQAWVRAEQTKLRVCIGTPGLGKGTFACLCHSRERHNFAGIVANSSSSKSECGSEAPVEELLTGVYPIADIEFPSREAGGKSIRKKVVLKDRCCGFWFFDNVSVPANVGVGKAKMTLSCLGWKWGAIAPAVFEIPVVDIEN